MKQAANFLLFFSLVFMSCEVKVNTPSAEKEKSSSKVRNGIKIKESGLNVEQAYLTYEDGSVVSNENKIDVNQKVIMKLTVNGWKEENGKVVLGASEKLSTSEGQVFLDAPDLFEAYSEGVDAKDAKYVTLSARITQMDKLYDYFLVEFRVWDKRGNGEVTGSYKLYLK